MAFWPDIEADIVASTGRPFGIAGRNPAAGGCINAAWSISGGGKRYFVKTSAADRASMFEAEAEGLEALRASSSVRVPQPVCCGSNDEASWIVLEHIALTRRASHADSALGAQLAAMHRCSRADFGWHRDNTIGSTPQINTPASDWIDFFRERRLRFQLDLAKKNGHIGRLQDRGEKLLDALRAFFADYAPRPSLLHGDLWSGNAAADENGAPVIFDPAVYYGDREADVAMTELFGGYSAAFHSAYVDAWPLDRGYAVRRTLYNLYHVLNHLNLFGGGYRAQAERMIDALLAQRR